MNGTGETQASRRRRLRNTPLRDVARGRISGRLDLEGVIEEAGLEEPLSGLVRRVARRTRLTRVERVEVARDLVEHFRDGLAAGSDAETLVREFGDERDSARLIRRSMLRKRPAWSRARRVCVQVTSITLAVFAGIYLIVAASYWGQRPIIRTDFVAQLNAPIVAIPESDRGWPAIRNAMTEVRTLVEPPERAGAGMTTDGGERDQLVSRITEVARLEAIEPWSGPDAGARRRLEMDEDAPTASAVEALYGRLEPMLVDLRAASMRPSLGREVTCGPPSDLEDIAFFGMEGRMGPPRTDLFANSVLAIELPHYPTIRAAARLLATDARRAVAEGDGARAVADLEAAFGLARQVREPTFLIGQLLAVSIEMLAFDVTLDAISTRPDAFTEADLDRLASALAGLDDARLAADLSSERLFFEDLAQRYYTDDGDGNGVLTVTATQDIGGLTPGATVPVGEMPSPLDFLVTPALANLTLDRRSAMRIWNDFFDRCEAAVGVEPWEIDRSALGMLDGRPIEETMGDWRGRLRYFPLNLLVPAIDNAVITMLAVRTQRDLVQTVVALERTRRRVGDWPSSLAVMPGDILPEPARDPFDGDALRYAIVDGVPVIWTIGPDLKDDGGREVDDRRDPDRGRRRIDSPMTLSALSDYWGAGMAPVTELDGDIVVWRGR